MVLRSIVFFFWVYSFIFTNPVRKMTNIPFNLIKHFPPFALSAVTAAIFIL